MKSITRLVLLVCLLPLLGCQTETPVADSPSMPPTAPDPTLVVNRIVEASCGECQFKMEGSGCDLAVRIDGKSYYVDGTLLDDHGDAHGSDGLCNCVRQAKVTGEIKQGRFVSTSFELIPIDKEKQESDKLAQLKKSRLGIELVMTDIGLLVKDIIEDGLLGLAGLKKGDLIIKLNDQLVTKMPQDTMRAILADATTATFTIKRDSETVEIRMKPEQQ